MNIRVQGAATPVAAQKVRSWLEDGEEIAFFDVREEGEFGWGHPLLAANLPYSRLELEVGRLVPRKDTRTVLIGNDDSVPLKAAARLAALGYTHVHVVSGGVDGWSSAGLKLFEGVNVPSKAFAEVVEHSYGTPAVSAEELKRLSDEHADFVVLDSRTEEEFARFHVPGAISVPGAELVHRLADLVPSVDKLVVVSCAGRTRGIIGAQSLINAGVPNRVVALAGGTQAWRLAALELETGERPSQLPSSAARRAAQERSDALAAAYGISRVGHDTLKAWRNDRARTTYLFDVRTSAEYAGGHLPGSTHVPGAQLLQTLDQWAAVHRARIVLVDDDGVRATVTAHWIKQMGWDVHVLARGLEGTDIVSGADETRTPTLSVAEMVEAREALGWLGADGRLLSVVPSAAHRKGRPEGAVWSIRPELLATASDLAAGSRVLILAEDDGLAALAALDLKEAGFDARVLAGGIGAWRAAGLPWDASPATSPSDAERIDFLTWNHDRHQGNPAASRAYLDWEHDLPRQIREDGTAYYRIEVPNKALAETH